MVLWVAEFASVFVWQRNIVDGFFVFGHGVTQGTPLPRLRTVVFNLMDFGGVGDGVIVNTEAFERATLQFRSWERDVVHSLMSLLVDGYRFHLISLVI
ncbi:probable polygalacturonase [Fagus crenata]